jgi:hypothetical protein
MSAIVGRAMLSQCRPSSPTTREELGPDGRRRPVWCGGPVAAMRSDQNMSPHLAVISSIGRPPTDRSSRNCCSAYISGSAKDELECQTKIQGKDERTGELRPLGNNLARAIRNAERKTALKTENRIRRQLSVTALAMGGTGSKVTPTMTIRESDMTSHPLARNAARWCRQSRDLEII